MPRTGSGVPGAEGEADGDGLTCAFVDCEGTEAAGLAFGPGCVLGGAGGGFTAAAGWLCASELGPVTDVGFGVVPGLAAGDEVVLEAGAAVAFVEGDAGALGAGDVVAFGAGEACGAALAEAAAIGPATVGFFSANCTRVNCIAALIGIRAIPLLLSIHP